ncbi:9333_t:CDS:1, partial [Dentiscutata heterogama]
YSKSKFLQSRQIWITIEISQRPKRNTVAKLYLYGMKRTSFLTQLKDRPYCYKNDLG